MKAVFSACVAAALLLSVGCSSEPTADDFEAFALEYAKKATRNMDADFGDSIQINATLKTHDLRKTDSLTSPFVGTAAYSVDIDGLTLKAKQIEGYTTPVSYTCFSVVTFEWGKGEFKPIGGETSIVNVTAPELSDEQEDFFRLSATSGSEPLSQSAIDDARIFMLNPWVTISLEQFKKEMKLN